MPRTLVLLAVLASATHLSSQTAAPPKVQFLTRIDHGLGAMLQWPDGSHHEFHIEVSALRSRLVDRRMPTDPRAQELTVGSAEETKLLQALEEWLATEFSPEQQQELLALERLPDPRTQEEDYAHQRADLLRTVRSYREVTHPEITKVFAGRGTVSLSMQLRLGPRAPQQVLWRSFGNDAFARVHLDDEVEPVPIESATERHLLLGIANWLTARLGSREAVWQPEPRDLPSDVQLVLRAYRGYLEATSPRLRSAGTIMDAGNRGSKTFDVSDAQNRVLTVRFDYAAGTATPGRIRDGARRDAAVVELGSPRETELLGTLRRAAELRRRWQGQAAQKDWQLTMLETELETYQTTFQKQTAPK